MAPVSGDDERLKALVGCVHGLVLEFDGEGRYLNVWTDEPALLAKPVDEVIGRTIDEVLGEEGAGFTEVVRRVYATGTMESIEYSLMLAGQTQRWFLSDAKRVPFGDGFRVVMFIRDMTSRMSADQALRESEERHRLIALSTSDVLYEWDLTADRIRWSDSLKPLYGYNEVGTEGTWWRERIHPDDLARVEASIEGFIDAKEEPVWQGEYRFRRGDGEYAEVEDRFTLSCLDQGRTLRAVGAMRDVTEKRRLQRQVIQADRMAAMGTLAAGMGHEINNPLAYVTANLRFVQEELEATSPDIAELKIAIAEALQGATRVRDIVSSLKKISREDTSQTSLLSQVVDEAVKMSSHEIRHRAHLVIDLGDDLCVRGGPSQLVQVFLNLLINAAHACDPAKMNANRIAILGRRVGDRVLVSVSDTGSGIPEGVLGRIFEPFFTTKEVGEGTGLGLSVCHGIVLNLGGTITAMNRRSGGAVFQVDLPFAPAAEGLAPRTLSDAIEPRTVWIIDDDVNVGRALARSLGSHHQIQIFADPREALSKLEVTRDVDRIFCDLMMPGFSGMDFHAAVSASFPEILSKLVFQTGGVFTPAIQNFVDRCGLPLIEKPWDRQKLSELMAAA